MLIKRYLLLIGLIPLFAFGTTAEAVSYDMFTFSIFGMGGPVLEIIPAETEEIEEEVVVVDDSLSCYCVKWMREVMGVNIRGDADTIEPNIYLSEAGIGDVLLLEYGKVSHAALIVGFVNGEIAVIEANKKSCQVTERIIDFDKETLRGVYRPKENPAN